MDEYCFTVFLKGATLLFGPKKVMQSGWWSGLCFPVELSVLVAALIAVFFLFVCVLP